MDKHYGQIVEKVIRRNGFSISELARLLNVNRRSFYNWFDQKDLKPEIIFRIISVLDYDFQSEFSELFTAEEFEMLKTSSNPQTSKDVTGVQEEANWKNKYIDLLERYNELLVKEISREDNLS